MPLNTLVSLWKNNIFIGRSFFVFNTIDPLQHMDCSQAKRGLQTLGALSIRFRHLLPLLLMRSQVCMAPASHFKAIFQQSKAFLRFPILFVKCIFKGKYRQNKSHFHFPFFFPLNKLTCSLLKTNNHVNVPYISLFL